MKFNIEVTDTFGGEANYSWVWRYSLEMPKGATDRSIVIAAKRAAGWSGIRCATENYGDSFTLRPQSMCQVMFINYQEG